MKDLKNFYKNKYEMVKRWRENHPERVRAHRVVFVAIRNETLRRKPCMICNKKKAECHHEDYSKPLEVIWLCKKHHGEADKKRRLTAN